MSKKQFVDKDGKKFVEVTSRYQKWRVWGVAVLAVCIIVGLSFGLSNSSKTVSKATAHDTTSEEKGKKSGVPSVTVDDEKYDISDKKAYSVGYSNDKWSAAKISVDKVTVYKLTKSQKYESNFDGTFNIKGFVRLHVIVSPTRDLEADPTSGTIIYNNHEQQESSPESWDGDISKGVTKSGNVTLPIQKLANVKSLKTIRFKFDADYDPDDDYDVTSDHTYDFTVNL